MSKYLQQLEPVAREAGALLMTYFDRHITIEYKGDVDLVTAADRASEKLIVERLRSLWPNYGVVGEEGTRSDTDAEFRWYVDPLDGTTNFAHGYPVFCVSIALVRGDETLEAGVLYDPTRDELFAAERGAGATLNGKAIHVSQTPRLAESILGHWISQPQAAQEPQYSLLPADHAAVARRAPRRLGRARSRQRGIGAL